MKELNYQYKILEEKTISGKKILKVKDTIYDKIIFMEKFKQINSDDWNETYKIEQELDKMKMDDEIEDYYIHDDYTGNIKTAYKIYNSYEGFENTSDNSASQKTEEENFNDFNNFEDKNHQEYNNSNENSENQNNFFKKETFKTEKKMSDDKNHTEITETYEEISFKTSKTEKTSDNFNFDFDNLNDFEKKAQKIINKVLQDENLINNNKNYGNEYTYTSDEKIYETTISQEKTYDNLKHSSQTILQDDTYQKKLRRGIIIIIITSISFMVIQNFLMNSEQKKFNTHNNKIQVSKIKKDEAYILASSYFKKKQYKKALRYFKKSCNGSNKDACSMAAYILKNRLNNKKQALKYYQQACGLNDAYSCSESGYLTETELKNIALAKQFYEKGCSLKDGRACYNLALIYEYDKIKGIKNLSIASTYYQKGCEFGYKDACNKKLTDLKKDVKKIKEIKNDSAESLYNEAINYQNKKDYYNANLFFQKACTKGHLISCDYLGYNYYNGYGFGKSTLMAKKYYMEDCEKGSAYACNQIGYFYENGIEFKKDLKKAGKNYKKACNKDYALGCYNLGLIFEYGKGYKKDLKSAQYLYKKACKLGNKDACLKLSKK